jgi:AAT family amino acid transporter
MAGFPVLTVLGLVILAATFAVGLIGDESRPQLLSTFALVAVLAGGSALRRRAVASK